MDLAELSEKSAAMRERMHVPFHTLSSADEGDAPVNLLKQAETELSGDALVSASDIAVHFTLAGVGKQLYCLCHQGVQLHELAQAAS